MEVDGITDTLAKEIFDLVNKHPGLSARLTASGYEISGVFEFCATHNGVLIQDEYQLLMRIPLDYPKNLPYVFERGKKIPEGFDHVSYDGTLCLGVPMEIRQSLLEDPSLGGFVERYLISYLYSASHFRKHGTYPYGDRGHGVDGIYEYYYDLFGIKDRSVVHQLLLLVYEDSYRGHHLCPCGSKLKLRKCHGPSLMRIALNKELKSQAMVDLVFMAKDMEEKHERNRKKIPASTQRF